MHLYLIPTVLGVYMYMGCWCGYGLVCFACSNTHDVSVCTATVLFKPCAILLIIEYYCSPTSSAVHIAVVLAQGQACVYPIGVYVCMPSADM